MVEPENPASALVSLASSEKPRQSLMDYSQDRQPTMGFESEDGGAPDPNLAAQEGNEEHEPQMSDNEAKEETSQTAAEEKLESLQENTKPAPKEEQESLQENTKPATKDEQEPQPLPAPQKEVGEKTAAAPDPANSRNIADPDKPATQSEAPVTAATAEAAAPPLLGTKPSPPRNAMSLSPGAIDRRLRRVFTPKANGEYKVSAKFVAEFKKGGPARKSLEKILASCGYDPEPRLQMVISASCI